MQSTKKAPLRKEDGTTAAGDDVATIAQSAGPNTPQPVSHESIKVMQILFCKNTVRGVGYYTTLLVFLYGFPSSHCITCPNIAALF